MNGSVCYKILKDHLVEGELLPGGEIGIRIDQTLTQDATGTMAYLQFEALGVPRVKTEVSVSYVDHNTLQIGFENADDHLYLQTDERRYGILLLPGRQRHLPPGAPGALRPSRRDAAGLRQPHAHGRRHRDDRHRRRAGSMWPSPWEAAPFISPAPGSSGSTSRAPCVPGYPPRT